MFTGIVEDLGRIVGVQELDGGRRFRIRCGFPAAGIQEGASIAVDGACLTVVAFEEPPLPDAGLEQESGEGVGTMDGDSPEPTTDVEVEAIGTTLSRTVASSYAVGSLVNLERARSLGDRLEGHLVQGHVDGLATLERVRREGVHHLLDLSLPSEVWRGTILHGSITVNGVSLTVNALEAPDRCQVAIIPFTWAHTNLSSLDPGDSVNVEGDVIGKYVARYLGEAGDPGEQPVDEVDGGDGGGSGEGRPDPSP